MFVELVNRIVRGIGSRFLLLDAALPGPAETSGPSVLLDIVVPSAKETAVSVLLILIPIVVIVVLIVLLTRRHKRKKRAQEAEQAQEDQPK